MLRLILIAAGTLVVTAVEKLPSVEAYALKVRVIDGIVFALPFLAAVLWLQFRAAAKSKAAAAPPARPAYFGSQGRRG